MTEPEDPGQTRFWREAAEESEERVRQECLLVRKENDHLRSLQRQLELSQATLLETQSQLGHSLAKENEFKAKSQQQARDLRELCHEVRLIVSDVLPPLTLSSLLPQDFDPDSLQPYHAKTLMHMLRDAYLRAELRVRNREAELSEQGTVTEQMEESLNSWSLLLSQTSDPPQQLQLQNLSEELRGKEKPAPTCLREMHSSLSTFCSAVDRGYRVLSSELTQLRGRARSCVGGEESADSTQLGLSLTERWSDMHTQMRELENRLREMEQSRSSEMHGAISALKLELSEQRAESDREKDREMERQLACRLEEYKSRATAIQSEEEVDHARGMSCLSDKLSKAEREGAELRQELERTRGEFRESELDRNRQSKEAERLLERQDRTERESCEERRRTERRCEDEVGVYREQVRQHALTIVSLEDKLVRAVRESGELRENLRERRVQLEREREETHKEEVESIKREEDKLELELCQVRSQLKQEKSVCDELCSENATLKSSLALLKRQLLGEVERYHSSEKMLGKTKSLVSKLERSLEERMTRSASEREELLGLRQDMPHVRETVDGIHQNLSLLSHDFTDYKAGQDSEQPLKLAGAKCTNELHSSTISKQAQALSEMRSALEQMREANLLVPSHQESLKEVTKLRKQLRDAKAALAGSDLVYALNSGDLVEEELQKQLRTRDAAHLQDKLHHDETRRCLEISEESFQLLVTAVKGSLSLQIPLACNCMGKMGEMEREVEREQRVKQIELVRIQLKLMYENLKQSQAIVTEYQKSQIDDLRLSLDDVKGELYSQKELNLSLQAQREYFKMENLVAKKHPHHSCLYGKESLEEKLTSEKKKHKEKMRRKEQEIVALRATLARLNDTQLS